MIFKNKRKCTGRFWYKKVIKGAKKVTKEAKKFIAILMSAPILLFILISVILLSLWLNNVWPAEGTKNCVRVYPGIIESFSWHEGDNFISSLVIVKYDPALKPGDKKPFWLLELSPGDIKIDRVQEAIEQRRVHSFRIRERACTGERYDRLIPDGSSQKDVR